MDPLSVFTLLGSAASFSSHLFNRGYIGSEAGAVVRAFAEDIPIPSRHREILISAEGLLLIRALTLDRDLLEDLTKMTERALKTYRRELRRATSQQQRQAADRRAGMEICEHLNRVKLRNRGKIPTEYLQEAWDSFKGVDD